MVDTEKPYGPEKMVFKFYTEKSPAKVGYHWNNHAHSYLNIGRAMAAEVQKLSKPTLPSRLAAVGTPEGVRVTWQLGTETPSSVTLLRNGTEVEAELSATQTTFVDAAALPVAAVFLSGRPFPARDQRAIGLGWRAVSTVVPCSGTDQTR